MQGEKLEAVRQGIKVLLAELKNDPLTLDTAAISIITFNRTARQDLPLTPLTTKFQEPLLQAGQGEADLEKALKLLEECLAHEIRPATMQHKGDWLPLVFVIGAGHFTGEWKPVVKRLWDDKVAEVVVGLVGTEVAPVQLKDLSEQIVQLGQLQPGGLQVFFKLKSVGFELPLPAPPENLLTLP